MTVLFENTENAMVLLSSLRGGICFFVFA